MKFSCKPAFSTNSALFERSFCPTSLRIKRGKGRYSENLQRRRGMFKKPNSRGLLNALRERIGYCESLTMELPYTISLISTWRRLLSSSACRRKLYLPGATYSDYRAPRFYTSFPRPEQKAVNSNSEQPRVFEGGGCKFRGWRREVERRLTEIKFGRGPNFRRKVCLLFPVISSYWQSEYRGQRCELPRYKMFFFRFVSREPTGLKKKPAELLPLVAGDIT